MLPPALSCAVRTFLQCLVSQIAPATAWRASQANYVPLASNGLTNAKRKPEKSRTLRVTKVIRCCKAVAAIMASRSGLSWGLCSAAHHTAVSSVNGSVRLAKPALTLSSQSTKH